MTILGAVFFVIAALIICGALPGIGFVIVFVAALAYVIHTLTKA